MRARDEQFYWLIELLAYWEGRVQPMQLASICNISRQQASKKLNQYNQQNSKSLTYCSSHKSYQPAEGFSPQSISREAGEYLNWITGQSSYRDELLPCQSLLSPRRSIKPELMRPLIQALRNGRRVEVNYVSINNPDNQGRIIVPHHLVNTGQRWHMRAWCEKSQEFRDFVLGRFQGDAEVLEKSSVRSADDVAWQTIVTLIIAPDPRLDEAQRQVIEFEYAMQNGQLKIHTRACLLSYKLQKLNINPRMLEGEAKVQQLVIVNKDDIKHWLFD